MKNPVISFTRLFSTVILSTAIAACGSGGGDDDGGGGGGGGGGSVVPSDIFRVTCTVIDSKSFAFVEGASITFKIEGINPSPGTTTGADGKCIPLDIKAADVAGLTQIAASVVKAGYEPGQFTCPLTTGGTSCQGDVPLVPLAPNTSIPGNGDVVTHIGDGAYSGEVNSQFQTAAVGTFADFPIAIADWGAKLRANPTWTRATVVLEAKGWQTTLCPGNTIALVGSAGSVAKAGGDSAANGDWSDSSFDFDVTQVGKSESATLRITAERCNTPTSDFDDVETNRIRVYFCDGTTSGPCAPQR
jgi:hypothetical protein